VFVERDLDRAAVQVPAQGCDEHSLPGPGVLRDDLTVEGVAGEPGWFAGGDVIEDGRQVEGGDDPAGRRAADADDGDDLVAAVALPVRIASCGMLAAIS
jgi:hypothetical protein